MTPEIVFRLCNLLALLSWLLLIAAGRLRNVATLICKLVVPAVLSIVYLAIILTHWAGHPGGFGSVGEVQKLFADPWLVTAGWVHYLAFDLFLGAWQVRDAERANRPHWRSIPSLLLTFLFGPIGFLLHLGLNRLPSVKKHSFGNGIAV